MKSPNLHIFETVTEALHIITSRKRLGQVLTTPLYTNAFYLMVNTAVMAFLGFFFWMVVARFYTKAEVGYSSAIISATSFFYMMYKSAVLASRAEDTPNPEKEQLKCPTYLLHK